MSKSKANPKKKVDVMVKSLQYPDEKGGISLTATHPGFAALSAECIKLFKKSKGINYVEWTMNSGDPEFGLFTVTMQRQDGKTPAQKATAFAEENEKLRAEIEKLKKEENK